MRQFLFSMVTIFLFSVVLFQTADSKTDWAVNKQKDEITNFIAPVKSSIYNQYKAEGIINVKAETLLALFRDVSAYPNWVDACMESTILKDNGNDNLIVYYVHDAMFPVKNRDSVIQSKAVYNFNKGTAILTIDSIKYPKHKLNEKYVEMDFHAKFICSYLDREHVKVEFTVKFHPGGTIKPALVDLDTKYLPYKSLQNLRDIVKEDKYIALGKKMKELPKIKAFFKKK